MGQGQGQGWELVAEKLSGCSEAEGFVTHLETHSALAWVAAPPTPPPPPRTTSAPFASALSQALTCSIPLFSSAA